MSFSLRFTLAIAGAVGVFAVSSARACEDRLPAPRPLAYEPAPPPADLLPPQPYVQSATVYAPTPPPARQAPPWRARWTARRLASQYRWLDGVRDRFHRRWGWNSWRVSRFEAWYGRQRAELDQQRAELRHGWREHGRRWTHDGDDD